MIMSDRIKGTVSWFNSAKGYGFISTEESSGEPKDVFVHFTGIKSNGYKELYAGESVEFEISKNDKGDVAANVVALGSLEERLAFKNAGNKPRKATQTKE